MKLIIDIPERYYEFCRECVFNRTDTVDQNIIANGTPYNERPKGKWETVTELLNERESKLDIVKCPFCKTTKQGRTRFCSWCGADMRGEENDISK